MGLRCFLWEENTLTGLVRFRGDYLGVRTVEFNPRSSGFIPQFRGRAYCPLKQFSGTELARIRGVVD